MRWSYLCQVDADPQTWPPTPSRLPLAVSFVPICSKGRGQCEHGQDSEGVVQTSVCDCARVQGQQCVSSILCLKVPGCASSSVLLGLATGTLYLIDQVALAHLLYSPGCAYRYKQEASLLCRRHFQLWCKNTEEKFVPHRTAMQQCIQTEGRGWWWLEMGHGLSTGVLGSRPYTPGGCWLPQGHIPH